MAEDENGRSMMSSNHADVCCSCLTNVVLQLLLPNMPRSHELTVVVEMRAPKHLLRRITHPRREGGIWQLNSMALSNGEVNVPRWQIGRRMQSKSDDSMALSPFGLGRGEPARSLKCEVQINPSPF